MNQEAIEQIIRKAPKLVSKRGKLEAMKDGAYCLHGSWGFGRIRSYDSASNKHTIDFEGKEGHMMDPAFCVDKLEILGDDNLLVRYRTDRENLEKEMRESPDEFVIKYLESKAADAAAEGRIIEPAASSIELENVMKQLFGFKLTNNAGIPEKDFDKTNKSAEKQYRAWWAKAKEALFRNPRVACPKSKNESYVLRSKEEEMKPEQEVLREYFLNREPKKKILLAEKLYKTATAPDSVEEIKADLPKIKDELTEAIKNARSLNDSDRLHGIWVRNNLVRYLYPGEESKVEEIAPRSKDIILAAVEHDPKDGLNNLAKNLPSSYLERFLDLLTRIFVQDWRDRIIDLLKNSEGRFTKECVDYLLSWDSSRESHFVKGAEIADDGRGSSRKLIKEYFKRWLEEQTLRGPVILWIVKNRKEAKYSDIVGDLIGQDLLSAMLAAVDDESLQRETIATTARIPLADALSEDRSLIGDMLKNSTAETARDLAQTLLLNQGFEDLTKKSILARIIKKFPSVQSLVASKAESKEQRLLASSWSIQARREELEDLIKNKLPASKAAIEAARELGDLRENSEYKMAREHDEVLSARRAQLERDLSSADIIDFNATPSDKVGIGSIVTLSTDKGESLTCTILGAWDSDTEKNYFSYQTPLAQALLEHRVGDTVETNINDHVTRWTIKSLSRFIDKK